MMDFKFPVQLCFGCSVYKWIIIYFFYRPSVAYKIQNRLLRVWVVYCRGKYRNLASNPMLSIFLPNVLPQKMKKTRDF